VLGNHFCNTQIQFHTLQSSHANLVI